jgi:hypothetical protein
MSDNSLIDGWLIPDDPAFAGDYVGAQAHARRVWHATPGNNRKLIGAYRRPWEDPRYIEAVRPRRGRR